jgi:HEPN domain-containing protein
MNSDPCVDRAVVDPEYFRTVLDERATSARYTAMAHAVEVCGKIGIYTTEDVIKTAERIFEFLTKGNPRA